MTGLEKFEMYLRKELSRTTMLLQVLANSRDFENEDEYDFLIREKSVLDNIIHHFELFVKPNGESEGDIDV